MYSAVSAVKKCFDTQSEYAHQYRNNGNIIVIDQTTMDITFPNHLEVKGDIIDEKPKDETFGAISFPLPA